MRILILEDMPDRISEFARNTIGHIVCFVSKVPECIEKLQNEGPWDKLFLDHDLDGKVFVPSGPCTGWEVAEWLSKNSDKKPPSIILHSLNEKGVNKMLELLPEAIVEEFAWQIPIEEQERHCRFLKWYKENGKGRSTVLFSAKDLLWQGWHAALESYQIPILQDSDCTCTADQYGCATNPKCIIHGDQRKIR
jgi:CheY-like chemotaxis protein